MSTHRLLDLPEAVRSGQRAKLSVKDYAADTEFTLRLRFPHQQLRDYHGWAALQAGLRAAYNITAATNQITKMGDELIVRLEDPHPRFSWSEDYPHSADYAPSYTAEEFVRGEELARFTKSAASTELLRGPLWAR